MNLEYQLILESVLSYFEYEYLSFLTLAGCLVFPMCTGWGVEIALK